MWDLQLVMRLLTVLTIRGGVVIINELQSLLCSTVVDIFTMYVDSMMAEHDDSGPSMQRATFEIGRHLKRTKSGYNCFLSVPSIYLRYLKIRL